MADHGDTLLLGTRKGLAIFNRQGRGSWEMARMALLAAPISYACRDPRTGTIWAAQDHGHWGPKLKRSDDDGATWTEVALPKYPEGEVIKNSIMAIDPKAPDKPASLSYVWTIVPGGADQPGRLYLGTEPGGLFVSDDDGQSWELNRALWDHPSRLGGHWFGGGRDHAGIHSILIDPTNSKRYFIGVSCAGVFETNDDGATWTVRNKGMSSSFLPDPTAEYGHDPHLLASTRDDVGTIWQQNHCGIYRSTKGGQDWQACHEDGGPAFFGFAVVVDEQDADTAWVAPAISDECRVAVDGALCLCRTTDGGKSWTALREGLPQKNCYDLVFRHALDICGDTLVFGSTTGNAYLSNDRGESWQTLSHHLPLIYSARFA